MRCSQCQEVDTALIRDREHPLKATLSDLKTSAEAGCDLCTLIWVSLERTNKKVDIEAGLRAQADEDEEYSDAAVIIAAQLNDQPRHEHEALLEAQIYVSCGRWNSKSVPHMSTYLGVYVPQDDPEAPYFPGREILANPADDTNFTRIKDWLAFCDEKHDCVEEWTTELPSRYIDVGTSEASERPILCINNGTHRGRYIALSYVWGANQPTVTTRSNIRTLQNGINISDLGKSLQDAILITRKLGLRYLWIDAICIIQQEPDLEDFLVESLKMKQYYNNAYLTIAAECSADSRSGFLAPRPASPVPHCPLKYSRHPRMQQAASSNQKSTVFLNLRPSQEMGPLKSRAWTFQEEELSPRLLVYANEQIKFICQKAETHENGAVLVFGWSNYGYGARPPSLISIRQRPDNNKARREMLRRWCQSVQQYSFRSMTEPRDKLTAVAGMAEYVSDTVKSDYLFGLWAVDLVRGLHWRSTILRAFKMNKVPLSRPATARAPTWSWASVDGPVQIDYLERYEKTYHDATERFITLVSYRGPPRVFDPIRADSPFELHLRGILKEVRRSRRELESYSIPHRHYKRALMTMASGSLDGALLEVSDPSPGASVTNVESDVIGFGMFDVRGEGNDHQYLHVLTLLPREGLLLVAAENGTYRRVGTFWPAKDDWLPQGDRQDIVLV